MRRFLLLAPITLALAACGPAPDAQSGDPVPANAGTQPVADAPATSRALRTPLPNGVLLPFAYHTRTDRTIEAKPGVFQRRVYVEFLEGDASSVASGLIEAMRQGGYRAGEPVAREDGSVRVTFSHRDTPRVAAVASNELPDRPSNPASLGTLLLVFPADAPAP